MTYLTKYTPLSGSRGGLRVERGQESEVGAFGAACGLNADQESAVLAG